MKNELTPWFADYIPPHWIGYYDTKWLYGSESSKVLYWDGQYWLTSKRGELHGFQCNYWRGLAKKP